MLKYINLFLLFSCFLTTCSSDNDIGFFEGRLVTTKTFMFWPNATVPFYINPDHFDHEQATVIMTCLAKIAFKTCIRFSPVMTAPEENQHVMTFINPDGIRRCRIEIGGHSNFDPHLISLGYDCLKSPEIDMLVLRALGLPFEHNRMSRDIYISVMIQNVDPSYIQLFTKDSILPPALRVLPYDMDSVMHFGERDYSKNGHKTIIFKNPSFRQNRNGITATDVKKIEMIYGPECKIRDRAEKIALCQSYPGVARRKREITEPPANMSLRVNPNITPPPHIIAGVTDKEIDTKKGDQECILKTLGVGKYTEKILDLVYQLSNQALKNARDKYCNKSGNTNNTSEFKLDGKIDQETSPDVLGILEILRDFAKAIVHDAVNNLTEFCQNSETIEAYQKQCKFHNDTRCPKTFRSNNNDDKKDKADDTITKTTLKPHHRRKREVSKTGTTNKTAKVKEPKEVQKKEVKEKQKRTQKENTKAKKSQKEKKIGVVTEMSLKDKVKAIRKERLNEIQKANNTITTETVKPTLSTIAYKIPEEKKKVVARKFSEKRYQIQNRDESGEASDVTLEKTAQIEPQKTLKKIKKSSVQDASSEVVDKEEKSAESVEENKGKEDGAESVVEEESEEEIHKKADQSKGEEDDEEEEEKPQNRHKVKKHKRKIPKTVELTQLNKEFYTERRWPDGDLIYVIADLPDYDLADLRRRLSEVDRILRKKTCVKLREVDAKEAPGFDDYMILDNSPDYVTGKVGGKQNFGCIELFEGGQHKQHTAMMVMAMLGFYFEVSRHDRDKHIRVHNRHIRPDKLHHFEKLSEESTLNIPYDFKSATHPSYQFWRKIGKTGLATVATYKDQDPNGSIMQSLGQNPELLSESDILKINSVYGVDCFKPISVQISARKEKEAARMQKEQELVLQ